MDVVKLAERLVGLLAVIPGAYRPPNGEGDAWAAQLRSLLTWVHAWSFALFLSAWYLDRQRSADPDIRKVLKTTLPPVWISSNQADLFARACQLAAGAKAEWEATGAAVAMAAAINALGLAGLRQVLDGLDKGSLASIVIFPTTNNPVQSRFEAILEGKDPRSVPMQTSRLDRFNRADFEARETALSLVSRPAPTATDDKIVAAAHLRNLGHNDAEVARLLAGPPAPPAPPANKGEVGDTDETASARAHLLALGYSAAEAKRLLDGPKKA